MRKLKSYSLNSQQKVNTQPLNTGAGSNLKKWCCPRALCWLESSMSRSGWADGTAGSTHHTSMLQASSKLREPKCWLWCGSMEKVVEKINQTTWLLWYYIYDLVVLSMVWKKRVYCNSWENFPFWNSTLWIPFLISPLYLTWEDTVLWQISGSIFPFVPVNCQRQLRPTRTGG